MPCKLARMDLNLWIRLKPVRRPLCYGKFLLLIFFGKFGCSGPPPRQFRIADGELIWRVENQDELPPSAQLITLLTIYKLVTVANMPMPG